MAVEGCDRDVSGRVGAGSAGRDDFSDEEEDEEGVSVGISSVGFPCPWWGR